MSGSGRAALVSFLAAGLLASAALGGGCGDNAGAPPAVVVTTELTNRWDLLPHRLSRLELTTTGVGDELTAVGQNDGGTFGAVDRAVMRQAFTVHRSDALAAVPLSVELELAPTGGTDPEAFVVTGQARGTAGALAAAGARIAVLRGYRISTDEYAEPPPFQSDPELPYDPADGFTTQGVGLTLGEPTLDGGELVVPVSARVSLGPSDRGDMNAAIPQARVWVRVDLLVLGAPGVASEATRGSVAYTLSTATYGQDTVHPHADDAAQLVTLDGAPGLAGGVVGLSGFELWINAPGRFDPACVVVQDEINSWGEMISGPGRYVTELSTRLWDVGYDAAAGRAEARVDLYVSNRSTVYEEGNLCVGASADVSLLQLDAEVERVDVAPIEVELAQDEVTEAPVTLD